MKPMVFRREEGQPYRTKDDSSIVEIFHPNAVPSLPYSLAEATVLPGEPTIPHRHLKSTEIYYILEGHGILHLGEHTERIGPDEAALIPKGTPHSIAALEGPLRFLCICCPPYDHEQTHLESYVEDPDPRSASTGRPAKPFAP